MALTWPLPTAAEAITVRWPERYGWENAVRCVEPIRHGLEQVVRMEPASIEQPVGNIVVFQVQLDGARLDVGLDYEDRPALHEAVDVLPLLFKLQHAREGYGRGNVVPGGYVTNRSELYRLYPRFRRLRDSKAPDRDLYGRFSLKQAAEVRRRAIQLLNDQRSFGYDGGLSLVLWSDYMREACRARACLDLPGRGPFCYRLVEYLATGACVVGPRHAATLHVPLLDGEHIAYVKEDLSDLVEVVDALVHDDDRRARQSAGARSFFDRYLRPEQLGSYYLHQCLRALGEDPPAPAVTGAASAGGRTDADRTPPR